MTTKIPLPPLHRPQALSQPPATFVWPGGFSQETLQHAYFRRTILLEHQPNAATLHLFADANYHLRVNGQFAGYGPCRFYPDYPEYDTVELTQLLKPGKNVIAVWVWNPGAPNFHRLYGPGGFIAWGEIETANGRIDLATPGDWRSTIDPGFDETAPKFSFAQGPIQLYDERCGLLGWDQPDHADETWESPAAVAPAPWGALAPRLLPKLDHEIRTPRELMSAHRHKSDRDFYGFSVLNKPDPSSYYANRSFALTYTYIHSPTAQQVRVFTKWGENYLNGTFLTRHKIDDRFFCDGLDLDLREGWNFFFVKRGLFEPRWDFALSVPGNANLTFSAERKLDGNEKAIAFYHAGPFDPEDEVIQTLDPSTLDPDKIPDFACPWIGHTVRRHPTLPALHQAWAEFEPDLALPKSQTADFAVPPGGSYSYCFDMGGIVLGMPFVEFEAPEGTIIETAYTEDLKEGRPWLLKNIQVLASDRQIAKGGRSRMKVFTPRGFRYLQLTVSAHSAPVRIERLGIRTATYPHRAVGSFECSNPDFNELYAMGWRTLVACSEDVYTDCPWRERTLYAGDMLPEFATAYVTSNDTELIKRCIDIFVQSQSEKTGWQISMAPMNRDRETTLADYALTCLIALVWHFRLTGDRAFAEYTYPRFKVLMERALDFRYPNRLFALFNKPFIEHGPLGRDEDFNTALNALFVGAFEAIAILAREFGEPDKAAEYEQIAHETALAVESRLWNPEIDAFSDGIIDHELTNQSHGVTNGYCSFFGTTTPDREQAIVQYYEKLLAKVTREDPEALVSSYGAFFLLGGLYRQGHTSLAERVIEKCYGYMIEDQSDTVWEHFDNGKSHCHAWSTAPNFYFATCTLGVKLGVPDTETTLDRILVQPQSDNLQWARGTVPHPLGPVCVDWRIEESTLSVKIVKPREGVEVEFKPLGRLAKLNLSLSISTRV